MNEENHYARWNGKTTERDKWSEWLIDTFDIICDMSNAEIILALNKIKIIILGGGGISRRCQ
jgi:hypothetical protein